MELGISMFGDLAYNSQTQKRKSAQQRLKEMLEEIKLADEVGLDVFGLGEHHRPDYSVSSPQTVLAAAATITKNIKLGSAVSVLSSDDPIRLYQQFATIDLISDGRAEIMVGRGSFIESFPLFGYDLKDYDRLFEEKLELLLTLNDNEIINWEGHFRAPVTHQEIFPKPLHQKLPIWIAVGGTPESVLRAAKLGLPLTIAIIGGYPVQFEPLLRMYKEQYFANGHSKENYELGVNSHLFVGNDATVRDVYFPYYAAQMNHIGKDRGWAPFSRAQFEATAAPDGAYFMGGPEEITDKILQQHEIFNHTRFVGQIDIGGPDHSLIMKSIELFGTKVAPEVRKHLSK